MLSSEELALLDSEERVAYGRTKGKDRDHYERILRERLQHRAAGLSPEESRQKMAQAPSDGGVFGILVGVFGVSLFCVGLYLVSFAIWFFEPGRGGSVSIYLLTQQVGMTILGSTLAICGSVFCVAARIVPGRS